MLFIARPVPAPFSEHAFGDDDHIARHQHDIGGTVAFLEQVTKANGEFLLPSGLLLEADQLGPVARWVYDQQIALELSPSSNLQTGAIAAIGEDLEDHPFDVLYELGFNVTVNVDNRLMSATTLTRELELLVDTFGYGPGDLEQFQLNAAMAAFQDLEAREELVEIINQAYSRI